MIAIAMEIKINRNRAAECRKLLAKPAPLLRVLGRGLNNELRRHFIAKDQTEPSYLGQEAGRRQHFWRSVQQSVSNPTVNESAKEVSVAITDPRFAQKLRGGRITAKRTKFLTIPAIGEAYGRRASVFEAETGKKLFPIWSRGVAMLAFRESENATSATVAYFLRRSVNQKPDPTALPPEKELETKMAKLADEFIDRTLNK